MAMTMMTATTTTTTTATKMMYGRSTPSLRRAAAGRSGRTASAGRSRGAGDRLSERRRPLCPPCLRSTWPAPSGWLPCRDGGVVTVSIYRGRTGGGGESPLRAGENSVAATVWTLRFRQTMPPSPALVSSRSPSRCWMRSQRCEGNLFMGRSRVRHTTAITSSVMLSTSTSSPSVSPP